MMTYEIKYTIFQTEASKSNEFMVLYKSFTGQRFSLDQWERRILCHVIDGQLLDWSTDGIRHFQHYFSSFFTFFSNRDSVDELAA